MIPMAVLICIYNCMAKIKKGSFSNVGVEFSRSNYCHCVGTIRKEDNGLLR